MRTVLVSLLLAASALAKPPDVPFIVDQWRIEGTALHFVRLDLPKSDWIALSIDAAKLARRLEIKEEAVPEYLKGLAIRSCRSSSSPGSTRRSRSSASGR